MLIAIVTGLTAAARRVGRPPQCGAISSMRMVDFVPVFEFCQPRFHILELRGIEFVFALWRQ